MKFRMQLPSFIALLLYLIAGTLPAMAGDVLWTVDHGEFIEGGTLSGFFLYDDAVGQVRTWSLSVSGGDTANFPPFVFDTRSSTVSLVYGTFTFRAINPFPNGIRTLLLGPFGLCSEKTCVSVGLQRSSGVVMTLPASDSMGLNHDGYSTGSSCRCRALSARFGLAQLPDLSVALSHQGNFQPGLNGAAYTIQVSNVGPVSTSGPVTVTDFLPAGLTAAGISGSGWICIPATLTCTRSDTLDSGGAYPVVTVIVNVAPNVSASLKNTAIVSGGGEANTTNNVANDPTVINPVITTESILPAGAVDSQYQQSFIAGGGSPPYAFASPGPLPPGLHLDTAGVLNGIPLKPGIYNFIVAVADANGGSSSTEFWLTLK
jgi:uncharacterized protein DUF11